MTNSIKTAVFPVAGLGTRFLPVTKAGPKEMLPIVDKPLIQYVVEEAVAVGVTQLVFVTSASKRAIEDYFDRNYELETRLTERGKLDTLKSIQSIVPKHVSIAYVRQTTPRGLGDAVLCARHIVGEQPFAVLLADDIMQYGAKSCLQDMVDIYAHTASSSVAVQRIPQSDTDKYGIVSLDTTGGQSNLIQSIIEKPAPANAPSNLAVTGRYILTPRIFELLENTGLGVGGEVQLTDAIAQLLKEESVFACPIQGKRYDCGSRIGFLEATIDFALQRPELADRMQAMLQQKLQVEA